jgi:hypothetical protein
VGLLVVFWDQAHANTVIEQCHRPTVVVLDRQAESGHGDVVVVDVAAILLLRSWYVVRQAPPRTADAEIDTACEEQRRLGPAAAPSSTHLIHQVVEARLLRLGIPPPLLADFDALYYDHRRAAWISNDGIEALAAVFADTAPLDEDPRAPAEHPRCDKDHDDPAPYIPWATGVVKLWPVFQTCQAPTLEGNCKLHDAHNKLLFVDIGHHLIIKVVLLIVHVGRQCHKKQSEEEGRKCNFKHHLAFRATIVDPSQGVVETRHADREN